MNAWYAGGAAGTASTAPGFTFGLPALAAGSAAALQVGTTTQVNITI